MLDERGSVQWPCNDKAPRGLADHAHQRLRARQGQVHRHRICRRPTRRPDRASRCCSPPAASCRQYNVGAQTRRTDNSLWHEEDLLEIHPHDAEQRGIRDGDWVKLAEPRRRDDAARTDHRPCGAGRRLYDVPSPGHAGQRHHHRLFRLGDQLPGIQGHRGADLAVERPDATGRRQYDELARQSRRIAPVEAAE